MNFAPLRLRSGYSFLRSGLTMSRLFHQLSKFGYHFAGLADQGVLYGAPSFVREAKKNNLFPVLGIEMPYQEGTAHYTIVVYAENEEGYRHLMRLSSYLSHNDSVNLESCKRYGDQLTAIIVCEPSLSALLHEPSEALTREIAELSGYFSHFYFGLSISDETSKSQAESVRSFAKRYGYDCVAFPLICYLEAEDAITISIVHAIANDEKLTNKSETGPNYLHRPEEYLDCYLEEECQATLDIAAACQWELHEKRGHLLAYPADEPAEVLLTRLTDQRLKEQGLDTKEYRDRLTYELETIINMGFADYFLIVADYVDYAKKHDIPVGPGRGSAASSLVSFLLGITMIDPLRYHLLFESFLNPARVTMPDIDIDFGDLKRDQIIDYLRSRYGHNRVANIVTFQSIGAKQAIRDIARVYDYPTRDADLLSKAIPDNRITLRDAYRRAPAFRQLVDSDPYYLEIIRLASKIEGLPRQAGLHAAGVILNEEPLEEVLPVLIDENGFYTSQYEMNPLADQGFLKMDILGLRNLTIIHDCVKLINEQHHLHLDPYQLPYEDPALFTLIATGKTMGLFQLESSGIIRAIKSLEPECFEDIVALLALFRPGPMDSIPTYARRKKGLEKVTYFTDDLQDILAPTYGIIVYQEQILQIVVRIAGFSLSDADLFRRAISKKDAHKLESLERDFMRGAIQQGYSASLAAQIYDHILRFADYGFKRTHSVAYAVLSCQMAYLKCYYPLEFYATILASTSTTNDTKFTEYVSEMKELGIHLAPPDILTSSHHFTLTSDGLRFPLTAIKGVSYPLVEAIIKARQIKPFTDFFDFVCRLVPEHLTTNALERLVDAGAFDGFQKTRATLRDIIPAALQYAAIIDYDPSSTTLFDDPLLPPPALKEIEDDPIERLEREADVLGIMLSQTPLMYYRDILSERGYLTVEEALHSQQHATVAAICKSIKTITTRKGTPMAFLRVFDDFAEMEVVVFPNVYANSLMLLEKNHILLIEGHLDEKGTWIADSFSAWEETNHG